MSIVVLPGVIFPQSAILAGVAGHQSRQNQRTVNQGGYATINVVRDVTTRSWQIGVAPMSIAAAEAIMAIYEVTDAGAFGMLLEDVIDNKATLAPVILAGGIYQLWKRYTAPGGTQSRDRRITRPNAITMYRNGVLMASGYSVDATTGIITITSPGTDTFTWSGTFYVPVHFRDDTLDWDLVVAGSRDSRMVSIPSTYLDEIRE